MTEEGTDPNEARSCVRCDEPLPGGRSVCPACGTLQPGQRRAGTPAETPLVPRTIAPIPPAAPRPSLAAPAGPRPTGPTPVVRPPAPRRRRRGGRIVAVVLIVLACVAGGVAVAQVLNDDDSGGKDAKPQDPRTAAIRGFCTDAKALTTPKGIATFTPGQGTVAYLELPQPASSTAPDDEAVVQVSPVIGTPDLQLDKSVALVSLALCVDQSSTTETDGVCDFTLTNKSRLGEKRSAPLVETTYRVRLVELRTGKVLARGNVVTPTDTCPTYAYLGGQGVSNPLTDEMLLAWLGQHLVDGQVR